MKMEVEMEIRGLNDARDLLATQLTRLKPDRPRALDAADVELALLLLQRAVDAYHDKETIGWRVTLHGGFLPNSYKWSAETDTLTIYAACVGMGGIEIANATLYRNASCKRPHGRGSTQIVRIVKEGQSLGRVVSVDSLLPAKETK